MNDVWWRNFGPPVVEIWFTKSTFLTWAIKMWGKMGCMGLGNVNIKSVIWISFVTMRVGHGLHIIHGQAWWLCECISWILHGLIKDTMVAWGHVSCIGLHVVAFMTWSCMLNEPIMSILSCFYMHAHDYFMHCLNHIQATCAYHPCSWNSLGF